MFSSDRLILAIMITIFSAAFPLLLLLTTPWLAAVVANSIGQILPHRTIPDNAALEAALSRNEAHHD